MHQNDPVTLLLIDFDHANERHAELTVSPTRLQVDIERRVETNSDYLTPGTAAPPDWSDSVALRFATGDDLQQFVVSLSDQLLDRCFAYFDDDESEVDDSDDARTDIARRLADVTYAESATGPDTLARPEFAAQLAELLTFPR
jgi:hypothetical protein